jgi:O-antigen/teichoic acid export membrane protein
MPNSRLLLHTLLSTIARFTGVALNFLARILITRTLSVAEAGVLFLLMTLVSGISLLSRLGLEQLVIKEVAAVKTTDQHFHSHYLRKSYFLLLLLSLGFVAIWLAFSPWWQNALFHNEITLEHLLWASTGVIAFNIITINSFYLKAIQKTVISVLLPNALPAASFLLLLLLFWGDHTQQQLYLTLYIVSLVAASFIALGLVINHLKKPDKTADVPTAKHLLRKSLPLAPVSIFSFAMLWADTLLVGYFLDNHHLALFNIAASISFITLFFLSALEATIYPRLINTSKQNPENLTKFFWQATALVCFSLLLVTLAMTSVSAPILSVFKEEYVAAQDSLIILLFAQFFRASSLTFSFMFIIREQVKYLNVLLVVALCINILSNIYFINTIGMNGAAVATLIANAFLSLSVILLFAGKKLLRGA